MNYIVNAFGIPEILLKGKKIVMDSTGSYVIDLSNGQQWTVQDFYKEFLPEIRDYKLEFLLQD